MTLCEQGGKRARPKFEPAPMGSPVLQARLALLCLCVLTGRLARATRCTGGASCAGAPSGPAGTGRSGHAGALAKRGTGWGYHDTNVAADMSILTVEWWYNWGSDTGSAGNLNNGVEFVPMIVSAQPFSTQDGPQQRVLYQCRGVRLSVWSAVGLVLRP